MKVFLGWSGDTSHKVALTLHDWLPNVIQAVKPYVSSEDIGKGARWSVEIAKELESSYYGVICVTRENAVSPWINFEAGALSREIEKTFVTPFLFDLRPAQIQGPLAQFQHTVYSKDDIRKLLLTINLRQAADLQLAKGVLESSFEIWWSKLKDELDRIQGEASSTAPAPVKPDPIVLLADLLETARATQRESSLLIKQEKTEREAQFAAIMSTTNEIFRLLGTLTRNITSLQVEKAASKKPGYGSPPVSEKT